MISGDLEIIKGQLQARIGEVCRRWLPRGRDEGGQWVSFNPVTNDAKHHNPALKVRLRGGVVGAWKDWRSGDKGDVIGLIAYLEGTDTKGALAIARDFLGLQNLSREERGRLKRVELQRREQAERDDARLRAKKLLEADRLSRAGAGDAPIGPALVPHGTFGWDASEIHRHPAVRHAEAYFSARQVPLAEIPTLNPFSLRFSAATEWWKGAVWKHEGGRRWKAEPGPLFPAVHAGMRNRTGIVTCCHCTFLDPVRAAKAPVEPAKLMWGEAKGAVIELALGPAKRPFWQWDSDEKPVPVVLAEGIETALAFAVAGVPARIWACGSLAGIGSAPIDHPAVSWAMFARDNNDGNAQAQKQFAAALEQLETHGKTIEVVASHVGDDFNDLAKGEEAC